MKQTILFPTIFLLGLTLSAQVPTDNPMNNRTDSSVESAVTVFFSDGCHVGLSLAVFDNGKISFYNYGSVNKEGSQLPTVHSLYEIGSLTKTFTGTLLAKAVMDNKVHLDVDIRQYLRAYYPNLQYKDVPITLRQLSTHQSGLPNNMPDNSELFKHPDFDRLPYQLINLEKSYNDNRYREELRQIKLDTFPGSLYFKYSNIGVKLLGFVLEDVYNQSYAQMLKNFITKPLNMNSTTLSVKDSIQLVKGYSPTGKLMPYALDNAGAAGGIRSCTSDMARFLKWHMNEGNAWIRETHTLLHGDLFFYARAYNWNMEMNTVRKKIWQSGGTFGMSSALIMYPHEQVGFVLLTNDACMDTQSKLQTIAESVLGRIAL
jgi:CubicO group peptidase (beta-lactamase class C family)